MSVSSIGAGVPPDVPSPQQGGAETRIRSLEQKLRQLYSEREKAVRNNDQREKEKIEQKIKEIERQIEELRQRAKAKESSAGPSELREAVQKPSDPGTSVDFYR